MLENIYTEWPKQTVNFLELRGKKMLWASATKDMQFTKEIKSKHQIIKHFIPEKYEITYFKKRKTWGNDFISEKTDIQI